MATWTIGTRSSRKVCGIQPINTDKLWKSTIWLQRNDCSRRCKANTNITFVMFCWCCWWWATQRFTTCLLRLRCRFTNSKRWSCQGPRSNRLVHLTTGETVERALIVMQSSRLRPLSDTVRVMLSVTWLAQPRLPVQWTLCCFLAAFRSVDQPFPVDS